MTKKASCRLTGIDLFSSVPVDVLSKLERSCKWKWYGVSEQVIDQHSDSQDVFFVIEGRVRIVNYSIFGREITLDDIKAGHHFGELAAIDKKPRSASVISLVPSLLAIMPAKSFFWLLYSYPEVSMKQMKNLTRIIRESTDRIMELSTLAAKNRVQAELLRQAKDGVAKGNTAEISPVPIHGDIASRVSTTRETVARVLGQLAHRGIIERRKEVLVIHDVLKLEELVTEVKGS